MTVKMSSEGDSSKKLSSETLNDTDENDAPDVSPEAKKGSTDKKDDDAKKKDASKEASDDDDEKPSKDDLKKEDKKGKKDAKDDDSTGQEENGSDKDDDDEEEKEPPQKEVKKDKKTVQKVKEDTDSKDLDFPHGSGISLGNIPRIDASISRFKNDDMKLFHKVLFKTPGKTTMIKKNIKKFNGFEFKKDSDEYTKKVSLLHKTEVKQLKSICEMLDLQKTGTKDDIVDRVMDFLMEPKDSGKAVAGGRPKRTAAVRANNIGYSSHDNYSSDERHGGRTTRDKGRRSNLKDDSSSASDEDFEPSDEGSDEGPKATKRRRSDRKKADSDEGDGSELDSASSEDSDFQEEPKTKRRKAAKVNNKPKGKGTGKRGRPVTVKKTPAKVGRKKKESSGDEDDEEESDKKDGSSSSEDEPLVKKSTKATQPPTDDEIKTYVKEILEGANLEQITMKTVCQQVYAHYPDFDLVHKKDFIKSTVKSLIST